MHTCFFVCNPHYKIITKKFQILTSIKIYDKIIKNKEGMYLLMYNNVDEYLKQKRTEKFTEEYIKKAKLLINEGLYHVVYSPDNVQSSEYPFEEYDATSGSMKHYKKVPMNVTNDEFEQIKKYSTIDETPKNAISITLTVIAYIIFISGFIYGIYIGSEYYVDEFSFSLAFISWIITLISGMTFLGFAEIIKLLEAIKNK
jgi:hypothetical protein